MSRYALIMVTVACLMQATGGAAGWQQWDNYGVGYANGGHINEIVASGEAVYVGGSFDQIGGKTAKNIAKWNCGTGSWSILGYGISGGGVFGEVCAIAVDNSGNVYVGGDFYGTQGTNARNIAKWIGGVWDPLGGGLNGKVNAVAYYKGKMYAMGLFGYTANGQSPWLNGFARWNGSQWEAVLPGQHWLGWYSNAMAVADDKLYYNRCSLSGMGFYKYDGNTNSILGMFDGSIYAILVDGSDVYVGGDFTVINSNIQARGIAKYNGASWCELGGGVSSQTGYPAVTSLVKYNDRIYVGGEFTAAGAVPVNNIVAWDGNNWSSLIGGTNKKITAMARTRETMFVGGDFSKAGRTTCYKHAKYVLTPTCNLASPAPTNTGVHEIALCPARPNPCRGSTEIRYNLPQPCRTTLKLYNVSGQLVRTLVDEERPSGSFSVNWDCRDNRGDRVAAGVYLCHLTGGDQNSSQTLIVLP